jgi:Na+/melibiose symporter-like transporter
MYALSEGPTRGWTSPSIIGTGVAGIVLLVALVRYELRVPSPMIHFRLVGNRLFRSTTIVLLVGMAAFLGTLYAIALFFQDGLGLSALDAGLSTFPEAVGVMIGAQISTRLYPILGPRRLMAAGLIAVAVLALCLTTVGFTTSLWLVRFLMFLLGIAISHVFTPTQAAAFATISPAETGRASTLFNTGRQVGSALGVAILTTVMSAVGVTHVVHGHVQANLAAFHAAFIFAAALAVSAAVFAFFTVEDADAASTMVRRPSKKAQQHQADVELAASVG